MAHRELHVYLEEKLAGHLEQDEVGAIRFAYAKEWLDSVNAVPLSVSLPLQQQPFKPNETRPFFAGLLPEEDSRRLIARTFGISEKNDFALLERIGAECAGAVSLRPAGELPAPAHPKYQEVSHEELAALLAELPRRPLLAGERGIRLSLAGAQGKLALLIRNGRFFLPIDGAPSSHIIKPQSLHFSGLVENEFFCMRLASMVGLKVPPVEVCAVGDIRFLQVERFDRRQLPDGSLERIHQEDFCQALGIVPEMKYQQEGGPNIQKCFDLVRVASDVPGPDLLQLFDAVVFNFLIGNCDAHGKNFSLLREDHKVRLAPLYDLVGTQAYPELSASMAMKIGGQKDPRRLSARNWRKFFAEAGFGLAVAEQRLRSIARQIATVAEDLSAQGCAGADKVLPTIRTSHQKLDSLRWE